MCSLLCFEITALHTIIGFWTAVSTLWKEIAVADETGPEPGHHPHRLYRDLCHAPLLVSQVLCRVGVLDRSVQGLAHARSLCLHFCRHARW